jgi:hypothetical protein
MKSLVFVLVAFAVSMSFGVSTSFAAASFEPIFRALTGGEVERDAARSKLLAMSREQVARFLEEAKGRTATKNRFQVVRAFDVLRRRPDFDAATAEMMIQILKTAPKNDVLEERLALILEAKAGALTPAKIQSELQFTTLVTEPSTRRLGRLTALTDAMDANGMKPTAAQLESLLQNDVFEVRIHAVHWFRLAPPADLKERIHFLKLALGSKPVQVRESAYQTIASWSAVDVQALQKGDVLSVKCAADPSTIIRGACAEIQEKTRQP